MHFLLQTRAQRQMLRKSNFRCRVGVPVFHVVYLSNPGEYRHKSYIAGN